MTDATLLKKFEELSARVSVLETENTRLRTENRLLRQKLDQYIRHYFGGQRNEGLDKHQLELLLQGLPNVIALPTPEPKSGSFSRQCTPHPEAGERSAVIYTLLGSCCRCGVNPFDYLKHLFTCLPVAKITEINQFTPRAWAKAIAAQITAQAA